MLTKELGLDRFLFNLNALAELGEETTSPKDFQRVVKSALFMVMGTFSSSKGAILSYDSEAGVVIDHQPPVQHRDKVDFNERLQQLENEKARSADAAQFSERIREGLPGLTPE